MIRVHIADALAGVGISVVMHPEDGMTGSRPRVLHFHEGSVQSWDEVAPLAASVEPTLSLDNDCARALLDSLTRYYHGAEDSRALRRDYDAERARVDKLTATLGDVVKALVSEGG